MTGAEQVAGLCSVLSAEARVRIIGLLRERSLCVGALAARLEMSSQAISQHLRLLKHAGLVRSEKRGNFAHYSLNESALADCCDAVEEVLSPGTLPGVPPCRGR
jgi:DNA-binding transcriptional ArsR family regulator